MRATNSETQTAVQRQLLDTRQRLKRQCEAIETGAIEMTLVADRLRELKQRERDLSEQLWISEPTGGAARRRQRPLRGPGLTHCPKRPPSGSSQRTPVPPKPERQIPRPAPAASYRSSRAGTTVIRTLVTSVSRDRAALPPPTWNVGV